VETCHGLPVAVGYYPQAGSPCGATETAGNVAEWVADFYAADYYDRAVWPDNEQNPTGPAEGERRVTRGGSFATTAVFARVSYREPRSPDYSSVDLGFRCVSDAAE
jgi:formylglycine-generating enzyme required for sulfatase activity